MSAISSISASQSASPGSSLQAALQQAKRIANQAEATAQALEEQASSAQAAASSAQGYASALNVQAGQAQLNVDWTQQDLNAVETAGQISTQISSVVKNVIDVEQNTLPAVVAVPVAKPAILNAPVVNTQGQVTGKIINTSA
jgi:hypothetical protein